MRHLRSRHRLPQKPGHARMLKRNLVTSLLLYEEVRTTKKRAQVIQPEIDKLINFAKTHSPHVAIRHINRVVTDKNASRKIMEVFKDRYKNRASGLTKMVPVGARQGDGAELVDLTLLDAEIGMTTVKKAEVVDDKKKEEKPKKKTSTSKKK